MKKFGKIVISLFVIVLLAAACGGGGSANTSGTAEATPVPTLAPVEPTATEEAATNTPAPTAVPTATTAAPGNLPADLANAVNKTRDALALRYEANISLTVTTNGKPVTMQYMVKGEGNGTDTHLTFSGTALAGQPASYEYIRSGGQTYVKGLALGKADPNTWYTFPAVQGSALAKSAQNPKGLLSGTKQDDFKSGNFTASSIEILDLNPCEVWVAQTPVPLTHFNQNTGSRDQDREFKAIDKSDGRLWTCTDGYLHQVKVHLEGHDPAKPGDKATFDMTFHIFDFNGTITISPPANAQPFPLK